MSAEISICEPDQRVKVEAPSATPNDPLYPQQWNMKAIGVDKAWAKGQFGDPQRQVSTPQHLLFCCLTLSCLRTPWGACENLGHLNTISAHRRAQKSSGCLKRDVLMVEGVRPQVRVCMVDTGIDITHPDLKNNLWMNPVEMNGPGATAANGYQNGIDDDGNGETSAEASLEHPMSTYHLP